MIFEANILPSVAMKKNKVWPKYLQKSDNTTQLLRRRQNLTSVVTGCATCITETFVCGNNFLCILPIKERSIETLKTFAGIENTRLNIYIKGWRKTSHACAAVRMDLLGWLSCLLRMKQFRTNGRYFNKDSLLQTCINGNILFLYTALEVIFMEGSPKS